MFLMVTPEIYSTIAAAWMIAGTTSCIVIIIVGPIVSGNVPAYRSMYNPLLND